MSSIPRAETPVNPFCTGHGGPRFELLVATAYTISMLRSEMARGIERGIVEEVRLQQRNTGFPVDDVVVVAKDGTDERKLALQVKHNIRFTDNADFADVLGACWRQFTDGRFDRRSDRIGVALGEQSNTKRVRVHLQQLLNWARTSSTAEAFYAKVENFAQKRPLLGVFEQLLARSAAGVVSKAEVWAFLKCFVVLPFDFDDAGSRDSTDCWDKLIGLAPGNDPLKAQAAFSGIYDTVSRFAVAGGELTAHALLEALPRNVRPELPAARILAQQTLRNRLNQHVRGQLQREKHSKRYIPEVFVEIGPVKEKARLFTHPVLFLKKTIEEAQRLDLAFVNRVLARLSVLPVSLGIEDGLAPPTDVRDVANACAGIVALIQPAIEQLSLLASRDGEGIRNRVPAEKRRLLDEGFSHPLGSAAGGLGRRLNELVRDLNMAAGGAFLIVSPAGQGKTNFVCDLAERFLLPNDLPCLFFTGRELSRVRTAELGDYMARAVIGDRPSANLHMLLAELEPLCSARNAPLTIVIDGLNEHTNIPEFSNALQRLIQEALPYSFVRFLLTCRSEYFEHRFRDLQEASFSDRLYRVSDIHKEMLQRHKDHMVRAYMKFFKLSCPEMGRDVWQALGDDPFLLRIFCEAFGNAVATEPVVLPPQYDLCKDALFRRYLERKLALVSDRETETTGIKVGQSARYARLLSSLVLQMIGDECFTGIPVADLDVQLLPTLEEMLHEDIIVRKDVSAQLGVLNERSEQVSFTFDEFRDFLVAEHLVGEVLPRDRKRFNDLVARLVDERRMVAEGLGRYLFYALKKRGTDEVLAELAAKSWYDETFVGCIFSLEPAYVAEADVRKVRELFSTGGRFTSSIASFLIRRYDTDLYPVMNIRLLMEMIDGLDDTAYDTLMAPVFDTSFSKYSPLNRTPWPIEWLAEDVMKVCSEPEPAGRHHLWNLAELLIYLFPIPGENWAFPAFRAFRCIIDRNPARCFALLRRHMGSPHERTASRVWDMLADLVSSGCSLPREIEGEAERVLAEASATQTIPERIEHGLREFMVARSQVRQRGPLGSRYMPFRHETKEKGKRSRTSIYLLGGCEGQYVFAADPRITEQRFVQVCRVCAGTYAEEIAGRMYHALFASTVNLRTEYELYYGKEYRALGSFLYWRHNLDAADVKALLKSASKGKVLVRGCLHSGGDYAIATLIEQEPGRDCLATILRRLEKHIT